MKKYNLSYAVYSSFDGTNKLSKEVRYLAIGIVDKDGKFSGWVTDYAGGGTNQDNFVIKDKILNYADNDISESKFEKQYPGLINEIFTFLKKITLYNDNTGFRTYKNFFYKELLNFYKVYGTNAVYLFGKNFKLAEIGLSYFK